MVFKLPGKETKFADWSYIRCQPAGGIFIIELVAKTIMRTKKNSNRHIPPLTAHSTVNITSPLYYGNHLAYHVMLM